MKAKLKLRVEVPDMTPATRHDIEVELDFDWVTRVGCVVRGQLPENCRRNPRYNGEFQGVGKGFLAAILDWLDNIDCSMDYLPAYDLPQPEPLPISTETEEAHD